MYDKYMVHINYMNNIFIIHIIWIKVIESKLYESYIYYSYYMNLSLFFEYGWKLVKENYKNKISLRKF